MLIYNNCKMVYPKHSVIMAANAHLEYSCFCYNVPLKQY